MRLISLRVFKSTNNEVIRFVEFNETGLSLIVDETNKTGSGSNIGKTTAVKIIDLCLGAKSISSLYKEKDTGENIVVGDFLQNNKVVAELTCAINGTNYVFKRSLYKNGINEIDGVKVKNISEYGEKLKEIIFNTTDNKPTIRQLISKFIRLENSNEASLLKFLGNFTKNFEYQAIYEFIFGIDTSKSQNVLIHTTNENLEKAIEVICRKNGVTTLREFETKIDLLREEVESYKESINETSLLEDYEERASENQKLIYEVKKLEDEYSKANLKATLMKDKISKEEMKISLVDIKLLRRLYEESKLIMEKPIREFEDLETFHNEMVKKRIQMLRNSLEEIRKVITDINKSLTSKKKIIESSYVSFNLELREKFEEKYHDYSKIKIKLENHLSDYKYVLSITEEIEDNLTQKVKGNSDDGKKKDIEDLFNIYFKELTKNIIGESFAILLNECKNEDDFPIQIVGLNGKPGTGIKKAMITCLDMAHIKLIIEKKYHMPHFIVHDKMENIDLNELEPIITEARKFEGQYVFPILSDRINTLAIEEKEIVLRLSSKDKFFGI